MVPELKKVEKLLVENRTKPAILHLKKILLENSTHFEEILMIENQYNRLNRERRSGLQTREETEVGFSKITQNLLEVTRSISKDDSEIFQNENSQKIDPWDILIGITVGIAAAVILYIIKLLFNL